MANEQSPDAEEGDSSPLAHTANLYGSHGSVTGPNAQVINIIGDFGFGMDEFLTKLIASQDARIELLGDHSKELKQLKTSQEREIWRLQDQLAKVRGLVPPLVGLFVSLDEDRRSAEERRGALSRQLEHALDAGDGLRAEFDRLDRHLDDLRAQQDRVTVALCETRFEEKGVRNLLDAVRMSFLVLFGAKAEAELTARNERAAAFALPGRARDEEDLFAYASRVLEEAYEILLETHKLLKEQALAFYHSVVPRPEESGHLANLAKLESDLDTAHRLLKESKRASTAQQLKHEKELRHEKERLRQKQRAAELARPRRDGPSGLPQGLGLFLFGVLIREVLKLAPLSDTQKVVFVGLALVFAVLPITSLLKWSKSAGAPAQVGVAGLGAFCVVAGSFSWVIAVVFVLVALASVVTTKRVGAGFAIVLVLLLVLGAALPGVVWLSWSGFDWLARVL